MAYYLKREKTTSMPYILVDEKEKYMRLEGRCFQDGVVDFFEPIISWLDSFLATDFGVFTFDCNMDYFNSSTVKILSNMIKKMDKHSVNGNLVVIHWMTVQDNEIIIECGEDFKEDITNLEFHLVIE